MADQLRPRSPKLAYMGFPTQHRDKLRTRGEPVANGLLARTSPLSWDHVGCAGDFLRDRAALNADRYEPLDLVPGKAAVECTRPVPPSRWLANNPRYASSWAPAPGASGRSSASG